MKKLVDNLRRKIHGNEDKRLLIDAYRVYGIFEDDNQIRPSTSSGKISNLILIYLKEHINIIYCTCIIKKV